MFKSASIKLNLKGEGKRSRIPLSSAQNLNSLFDEFEEASMLVNFNGSIIPLTMRRENGKIKCRIGGFSNMECDFESCGQKDEYLSEVAERIAEEGLYFV